ncbi:Single-stranded DNA-binding protein, mitochondrial [Glycine soja]|uniref:Single-stranded DNA-binding protein, mitochondrial n=1 Tax=Glycine soja TaxID=3848 RepID=A0A445IMP1_GLYSO|nr:Single-stranded DNA-binding protein, mitochondrial [Glycine soja]
MNSMAVRLAKHLRLSALTSFSLGGVPRSGASWYSTSLSGGENDHPLPDNDAPKKEALDEEFDDFLGEKPELQLQGVDPKKGWGFRGVHKFLTGFNLVGNRRRKSRDAMRFRDASLSKQAIICGKVGQAPVQKILRNGRNITIFTVGTGGMFDQRIQGPKDLPKPAQWHRIAVHNDILGTYAVQQLFKNSSVYVEGDIETRVYNDSINGNVKSIPEICVRRDGRIRLIKNGESIDKTSLDELREGLF